MRTGMDRPPLMSLTHRRLVKACATVLCRAVTVGDQRNQIGSNLSYGSAPNPVVGPEQGAFAVSHRNGDRCTKKCLDLRLKLDLQLQSRPSSIILRALEPKLNNLIQMH